MTETNDRNVNQRDCTGCTPLTWAARQANEEVVGLLLTRDDVNPDEPDNSGRTALSWASSLGYEGVVRLLLTRNDVDPDRSDDDGQTALWWASRENKEVMIRLPTRSEINPKRSDNSGQTALSRAFSPERVGVAGPLLAGYYSWLDRSHSHGQTTLLWVSQGNEDVVRLLLTREDLNPDQPNHYGQTPLAWASSCGNEEVVRILLTREDVNPDEPDNDGRTPLSRAAGRGHLGVVKLLLTRDDVNPDEPDNDGRTALWWAFLGRHGEVVVFLLPQTSVRFRIYMTLSFAVLLGAGLSLVGDRLVFPHAWHTLITLMSFLHPPNQKNRVFFGCSQDQWILTICWLLSPSLRSIFLWRKTGSYLVHVTYSITLGEFLILVFGTRLPSGPMGTCWCGRVCMAHGSKACSCLTKIRRTPT